MIDGIGLWVLGILGFVLTLVGLLLTPLLFLLLVATILPSRIQAAVGIVLWPFYRIKVIGAARIPATGPTVIVANHMSWIDGFILAASVPRHGKALVNADYLRIPILGWCARRAGMIPVPQSGPRAQRAAIESARKLLDNGEIFGIFPEAQISRNGLLGKLYRGIELMIDRNPATVVIPAYLDNLWGSPLSYSGGRFFWKWPQRLRRTVIVAFGTPVEPPLTTFSIRRGLLEASVIAFAHRPLRDQGQLGASIDLQLPHLVDPKLGLLTASSPDFDQDGIKQIGQKQGSVGHPVPGIALNIVNASGGYCRESEPGRIMASVAGTEGWQETGLFGFLDRDGFLFLQ